MTFGPGKYDDLCTYVAEQTGITVNGGGVLLIVLGGNKGNGFACQCDLLTMMTLPDILEATAKQIRADMESGTA
jgi:hypothetical protein